MSRSLHDGFLVSKPYAWFVFALTVLLMLFDFIDRQIIVSMFPFLKAQWSLPDAKLAALLSVVSITVGLFALPVALLADRWSRVKVIVLMALLWSLATIACGFAQSYEQLLLARAFIGIGEAGYGAVGGALLSTLFPARMRSLILASFSAAAAIGGVLGVLLGGIISTRYGWQAAFGIVGVPGLVLALLYLLVRDYQTVDVNGRNDVNQKIEGKISEHGKSRMDIRAIATALFRSRSAWSAYVGGTLQLFLISTLFAWLPSFFNRAHGLPADQAGVKAAIVLFAASVGAIFWGFVADRLGISRSRNKLTLLTLTCSMSCLLLMVAFGLMQANTAQFLVIVAGAVFMTASIGIVGAVIVDVVHPSVRATAIGFLVFMQNIFGLAAGPWVAGLLSDRYGLRAALAMIPLFGLLAALAFLIGSQALAGDMSRAEQFTADIEAPLKPSAV